MKSVQPEVFLVARPDSITTRWPRTCVRSAARPGWRSWTAASLDNDALNLAEFAGKTVLQVVGAGA